MLYFLQFSTWAQFVRAICNNVVSQIVTHHLIATSLSLPPTLSTRGRTISQLLNVSRGRHVFPQEISENVTVFVTRFSVCDRHVSESVRSVTKRYNATEAFRSKLR